jgi:hypothetical protein
VLLRHLYAFPPLLTAFFKKPMRRLYAQGESIRRRFTTKALSPETQRDNPGSEHPSVHREPARPERPYNALYPVHQTALHGRSALRFSHCSLLFIASRPFPASSYRCDQPLHTPKAYGRCV